MMDGEQGYQGRWKRPRHRGQLAGYVYDKNQTIKAAVSIGRAMLMV
jgi:hypothetical protein